MPSARDVIAEAYRNQQDFLIFSDDFIREGASNVPDTMNFDIIKDSGAATVCEADQPNGILHMASAATTASDGNLVQSINEFVRPTAGKRFAMEARIKSSDADQNALFIGLAQRSATNPENIMTADNRLGFRVDDENASLLISSRASDIETQKDTELDLADDTYVKLGVAYDGAGKLDFHVNDSPVGSISTNIPATELAVALYNLSGDNVGTKALRCDYVTVVSER